MLRAIAINVPNSKLSIFFSAFLPQFASTIPRMVDARLAVAER